MRLMEEINAGQIKQKSRLFPVPFFTQMPRLAGVAAAVALAVLVTGSGTVYAAQGSLPGDVLYGVKIASEQARTALVFDPAGKVERYLASAERRIEEMDALADLGRTEYLANAATGFAEAIDKVSGEAGRDGRDEVLERVSLATSHHLSVLDAVLDKVPEQARDAVEAARAASLKGQETALKALAKHNPAKAMEIHLAAMGDRLARASARSASQDSPGVEAALAEYAGMQTLSGEISDIARGLGQDVTTVEQLVAAATAKHVETLAGVYDKVPEQAKHAIEQAMTNAAEEHGKAADALKDKGAEDTSPDMPSLPTSVPEDVKEKVKDAFDGKDKGPPAENPGGGNDKDKDTKTKAP